jgi:hypothetical protein
MKSTFLIQRYYIFRRCSAFDISIGYVLDDRSVGVPIQWVQGEFTL